MIIKNGLTHSESLLLSTTNQGSWSEIFRYRDTLPDH